MQSTPTSWKYKLCTYRYLHNTKKRSQKSGIGDTNWGSHIDTLMWTQNVATGWLETCQNPEWPIFTGQNVSSDPMCLPYVYQPVDRRWDNAARKAAAKKFPLHFSPFSNGWNMLKYRYVSKSSASKIQWFPFKIFGSLGFFDDIQILSGSRASTAESPLGWTLAKDLEETLASNCY